MKEDDLQEAFDELDQTYIIAKEYFSFVRNGGIEMFKTYIEAKKLLRKNGLVTCPKCLLKPGSIMGLGNCEYCGLAGTQPWGG